MYCAPKSSLCGDRPCLVKGKATVMSNDNGESDVTPTESETTCRVENNPRGNREIPETSLSLEMDRSDKARRHNADRHVTGKSDRLVLPEKRANNAGHQTAVESVEERRLTRENATQSLLVRTQSRVARSRGLWGLRERPHTRAGQHGKPTLPSNASRQRRKSKRS